MKKKNTKSIKRENTGEEGGERKSGYHDFSWVAVEGWRRC